MVDEIDEFYEKVGTNTFSKQQEIAVMDFLAFATTQSKEIIIGGKYPVYDAIRLYELWIKDRDEGRRPLIGIDDSN